MFDGAQIGRGLLVDSWAPCPELPWLAGSRAAPAAFFAEVRAIHERLAPGVKSAPLSGYDLYHDAVLRHVGAASPALVWHDAAGTARALSYRDLAAAASARAAAWRRAGVEAGQPLAVVRAPGPELVISLVAAWKLGVVLSYVPPQGRRFVASRLEAVAPQHLDAAELHLPLCGPLAAALLPDAGPPGDVERSHVYPAGAVAARLFDASAADPALPRELSSDALALCALRDGAVTMALRPGDVVGAPGWHPLEQVPALPLAALLCGATLVHLDPGELAHRPELLGSRAWKVLGVAPALRDAVLRAPQALRCAAWFRDPVPPTSPELWDGFVRAAGLGDVPALNLRWTAALGGCVLASPWRKGRAHGDVLPCAGVDFYVADVLADDVESLSGLGRLALRLPGQEEPAVSTVLVAAQGNAWLSAGTVTSGRQARTYPVGEVMAVLADLPGCRAASVCLVPSPARGEPAVALLLFVAGAPDEAALVRAARTRIAAELGEELLPDRVHCYPLAPRRDDKGAVDHAWCADQYLSGMLARKSRDPLFRALGRLRDGLTEAG